MDSVVLGWPRSGFEAAGSLEWGLGVAKLTAVMERHAMEKPAATDHAVHELVLKRWSPRSFSQQAVEEGVVRQLLEAARWAASCFNEQPWRYLVATKSAGDDHATMLSCLAEKNQMWAKSAPVLMISVARKTFTRNGKPNRHALYDVGQATAQMVLQATALGLVVHQMAGFDQARARELYSIPDDFEPVAAIAIGHQGEPEDLPDIFQEMERGERSRSEQKSFAFTKKWNQPL